MNNVTLVLREKIIKAKLLYLVFLQLTGYTYSV